MNWIGDVTMANEKNWHELSCYSIFSLFFCNFSAFPDSFEGLSLFRVIITGLCLFMQRCTSFFFGPHCKHLCVTTTTIHDVITMNWFKHPESPIFQYFFMQSSQCMNSLVRSTCYRIVSAAKLVPSFIQMFTVQNVESSTWSFVQLTNIALICCVFPH